MKLDTRMYDVILKYLQELNFDPDILLDIRPDIQPDIRVFHTNERNCI